MNNQFKDSWAIRLDRNLFTPGYLPGYATKEEATKALQETDKTPGDRYSVVYVREYLNRAMDSQGNYTLSTIAEQKEPGAK